MVKNHYKDELQNFFGKNHFQCIDETFKIIYFNFENLEKSFRSQLELWKMNLYKIKFLHKNIGFYNKRI